MNTAAGAAFLVSVSVGLLILQSVIPRGQTQAREVLTRTGARWLSPEERNTLSRKLVQAGWTITVEWFAGLRAALCGGFVLACLPLVFFGLDFFWLIFFAPLLYFAPGIWLNEKIGDRKSLVRLSLSDFSMLLSTALAAGADISTALREAGNGVGGPLAQEVDRALRSQQLGRSITDVLTEMAERVDVDELRTLVRTIVQAYRYGAPLAETMRAHSEQMRTVRRFEVMEMAGKLTVKLTVPVLIFMLLPCMLILGYPAMIALMEAF